MADVMSGLTQAFVLKLTDLLDECRRQGFILKPYFGLRDPVTQAKLWRKSRTTTQIDQAKSTLIAEGAPYLAKCLDMAGPQPTGAWETNALPGLSWHQYGEAIDCVWINGGKYEWSPDVGGDQNGYKVYARVAEAQGLTPLGPSIGDWGHVQIDPHGSPLSAYGYPKIDSIMLAKFGTAPSPTV